MDTEWCLVCDRQTDSPSGFCSDQCRRDAHSHDDVPTTSYTDDNDLASITDDQDPIIVHQVIDSSRWAGVAEWAANVPSGVSAGAPSRTEYTADSRASHPPPTLLRPKPATLAMSMPPQTPFFRSSPITTPSSPETSSSSLPSPITESSIGTPSAPKHGSSVFDALRSWVPSSSKALAEPPEPTFTILCRDPRSKAMRIVPCKVPSPPSQWSEDNDEPVWGEPSSNHPYRARQTRVF